MSDNYTNILITGGCGFIGSNFIRHLFFKYPEYRIVNLDALTYAGNKENLIDVQEKVAKEPGGDRYTFILGNVCDKDLLDKIFQEYRFKYVVHFAAETHVDRSIFNVSDFIETNIKVIYRLPPKIIFGLSNVRDIYLLVTMTPLIEFEFDFFSDFFFQYAKKFPK